MKKTVLIFIFAIIFFACKKEAPQPDYSLNRMCLGCVNTYYTSHYILNTIDATIDNKDTIDSDTIKYNGFFIVVYMEGEVITEQTYEYWASDGRYRPVPTQAFFINKIQKIEIIPDKPYNDKNTVNITDFNVYLRDKETNYTLTTEYLNKVVHLFLKELMPFLTTVLSNPSIRHKGLYHRVGYNQFLHYMVEM
jgi:hypothetical protein